MVEDETLRADRSTQRKKFVGVMKVAKKVEEQHPSTKENDLGRVRSRMKSLMKGQPAEVAGHMDDGVPMESMDALLFAMG